MVRIRMMNPIVLWVMAALTSPTTQAFLSSGRTECRKIGERGSVTGPRSLLRGNSNSNSNSNGNNDPNTRLDREDSVVLLPLYEAELAKLKGTAGAAIDENADDENDETGAVKRRISELEETIENARTAAEFGVRRIQAEFYDAFSSCDLETMDTVWSDSDDVCCVHPGMERLSGRASVMRSWERIFAGNSGSGEEEDDDEEDGGAFRITPSRVRVDICGRTAICTCVEETDGGRLEALNVYRREGGTWKMVNHMASPTIMRL